MWSRGLGLAALLIIGAAPVWATEPTNERINEVAMVERKLGHVRLRGSGRLSSHAQGVKGGVEVRDAFKSPLFVTGAARFDRERRLPYDLRRWGGEVGLGWALNETTDVLGTYRLDSYKVFNTGNNVDPAFRTVAGLSEVAALGVALQHDTRDDAWYPTRGVKARLAGELALRGLGGDYNFARIESTAAVYITPFRHRPTGTALDDVTFVERAAFGWLENMGRTDQVPFFERYFVGGSNTVRGHRNRWLTPRGLEDQFVGGDIELVNNLEARLPIFPDAFHRQLSAALFFDAGRAYRRFSELGDFGYGLGGGLRYVVNLWHLHGVVRADYGFSLNAEGDDSRAKAHVTFGMPF